MMRGSRRLGASVCLTLAAALGWVGRAAADPPAPVPAPATAGTKPEGPADAKAAETDARAAQADRGDCKLELVVEHAIAAKVKLSIDGERVTAGAAAFDTSAGRHVVTAVVGLKKIDFVTHLEPGQKKTLRVSVFEPASRVLTPMPVLPALGTERDGAPYSSDAWQRSAGLAVGGAGVVGIGVAGAFFADALHKRSEAAKACNGPTPCEPKVRQTLDAKAAESSDIAAVAAVTGFALAGAGAVLYLTAPAPPGIKNLRFSPTFASGGGGIAAKATF
jgi:hypothetical protein